MHANDARGQMLASGNTPAMIPRRDGFPRDTISRARTRADDRRNALMNSDGTLIVLVKCPNIRDRVTWKRDAEKAARVADAIVAEES